MIASTGNTCIQRLGISRTSQPMIHAASNRPEENMRMGVQRPHRWSSIGSPTSEGGARACACSATASRRKHTSRLRAGTRLRRRDADLLQVVPLELPGREALDMDVELVEAEVVAVAGELNLEIQFVVLHGQFADGAWRSDAWTAPGPIRCATR